MTMFNQTNYEKLSKILIWVSLLIFTITTGLFFIHRNYGTDLPINNQIFSHYGDFIGGVIGTIFSLIGVLLLIETLRLQRSQFNKQQDKNNLAFEKQQIETRFFELIKILRENSDKAYTKGYLGRRAIAEMNKEFKELFVRIKEWGTIKKFNLEERDWKALLINISYLIFFVGVDESHNIFLKKVLKTLFVNEENWIDFKKTILNELIKNHKSIKKSNIKVARNERKYLPYDGHQNVLGHYFRHLYQTVKYINSQKNLSYNEKYEYVKTLRAQLSSLEQLLFFYNSLSTFGLPWEMSKKISDPNLKLITKYNLVKNLHLTILEVTYASEFYPDVTYEGQEKTTKRKSLEKEYS